jgi:hypothetical protein
MSMFGIEPLSPAYGRKYTSKAAAQADFDANKDFTSCFGQYINKEQLVPLCKKCGMKTIKVYINKNAVFLEVYK